MLFLRDKCLKYIQKDIEVEVTGWSLAIGGNYILMGNAQM